MRSRQALPTPANTTSTKGPDPIADTGIHRYFKIAGKPTEVMSAFKTALADTGWKVSTVRSSDDGDGGGATIGGTNDEVYGVFDGGGCMSTTSSRYSAVMAAAAGAVRFRCQQSPSASMRSSRPSV